MNRRSASLFVGMICVLLFVGGLVHQAAAWVQKDVTVTKNDEKATIDCNGGTVSVRGDDNILTIKGECNKVAVSGDDNVISATTIKDLDVSGSDNTITVDTVSKISASGDDNTIKWAKGAAGKAPDISLKGKDNKISQTGK
jgi:hypothetical protein